MIKKKNKNKSIYRLLGAVFMVAFSVMFIKGVMQQPQITKNEDKIDELQEQIEYEKKRTEEIENIKSRVISGVEKQKELAEKEVEEGTEENGEALEVDTEADEYIEKVAREKLGLVKRDEIIFVDISEK